MSEDDQKKVVEEPQDIEIGEDDLSMLDEEMTKKIQSLHAIKTHHREKRLAAEKERDELRTKLEALQKPEPEPKPKEKKGNDEIEQRMLAVELKTFHPDLDADDIKEAMAYAKAKEVSPAEAVGTPLFQAYLARKAEERKEKDATPSPSPRSGSSHKDYKGLKDGDIVKMSNEEFEKYKEWLKSQ